MISAFLLALREGLEAALVLGLLLSVLTRWGLRTARAAIGYGALTAGLVSLALAGGFYAVGLTLEGSAEKIFEGGIMLLAAAVLTWMLFWMRRHAPHLRGQFEAKVRHWQGRSGLQRGLWALAFLAVVREGTELALFVTALTFKGSGRVLTGTLAGLLTAALLGWGFYTSGLRLHLRLFFRVTRWLLLAVAAGLVAQGVHELVELGWLPALIDPIWNTNQLLAETSLPGQLLKALFGYHSAPSLMEVGAYGGYLVAVLLLWRHPRPRMLSAGASSSGLPE